LIEKKPMKKKIGKDNIIEAAAKQKIHSLKDRPLLLDSGEEATDRALAGYFRIATGFREAIIYRVSRL